MIGVLLAGGSGTRLSVASDRPKPFVTVNGQTLFERALRRLERLRPVEIRVAARVEYLDGFRSSLAELKASKHDAHAVQTTLVPVETSSGFDSFCLAVPTDTGDALVVTCIDTVITQAAEDALRERVATSSTEEFLVFCSPEHDDERPTYVRVVDDRVVDVGRHLSPTGMVTAGVYRAPGDFASAAADARAEGVDSFGTYLGYYVRNVRAGSAAVLSPVFDVDNDQDLLRANVYLAEHDRE